MDSPLSLTSLVVPIPPPHLPLRPCASLRLCVSAVAGERLLKLPLTLSRKSPNSIVLIRKPLETQFCGTHTFQMDWKFPREGGRYLSSKTDERILLGPVPRASRVAGRFHGDRFETCPYGHQARSAPYAILFRRG